MLTRSLVLVLLATGVATAVAQAAPPPGPPWPVNHPLPNKRPATDAPQQHFAVAELDQSAAPIGAAVTVRAAIANPKMGGEYELRYQIRVHTKKGEHGALLGLKDSPNGVSYIVRKVKCEYDWIEFYETFDITRKDLSGMTNLPQFENGLSDRDVVLRIEPQLYDVAEKKWLTPAKTPAAIVVATVGSNSRVFKLRSLSEWLVEKARAGESKKALETLADLDEFNTIANRVQESFHQILEAKDVAEAQKLLVVAGIEAEKLNWKSNFNLKQSLEALAKGPDGQLKDAAKKKLDEAK